MMKTLVFVGNSRKGGVSVHQLEQEDGGLFRNGAGLVDEGAAPGALSPDGRFLYAAVRGNPYRVAAFRVDPFAGGLYFLNIVDTPATVVHMAADPSGRFLLVSSYLDDAIFVLALGRGGMAQRNPVCFLKPGRNPHCVCFSPSGKRVYAPILGSDMIAQYDFNSATGGLTPAATPFVPVPREAGVRHLALSPDGRFVYALTELSGEIMAYAVRGGDESLVPLHSAPLLPPERALPKSSYTAPANSPAGGNSPAPVMWSAEIRITPDGRFLYASERTGSTISCFRIDAVTGRLDFAGIADTEKQPRCFAVDPFGRYLVAAGEKSNSVGVHAIDQETGLLSAPVSYEAGTVPNWVEIVSYAVEG